MVVFMSVPSGDNKKKVYADMLEGGPGKMQKPLNLLNGLSTISMEEHKVLLSLDRLDQLLQCEHLDYTHACSKNSHIRAELVD